MKHVEWNDKKNIRLKKERGVSFEDVVISILEGRLLAAIKHTGPKYVHQKIFIVDINNYAYLVPFVEDEEKIFLKTIIPNRQATVKYLFKQKIKYG